MIKITRQILVYLVICIIFAPSTNNFGIFAMAKVSTATVRLVLKKNRDEEIAEMVDGMVI